MSAAAPKVQKRKLQMVCEYVWFRVDELSRYKDCQVNVADCLKTVSGVLVDLLGRVPFPEMERDAAMAILRSVSVSGNPANFVRRVVNYCLKRFVPTYLVMEFGRYEMDHAWREWKLNCVDTQGHKTWHAFMSVELRWSRYDDETRFWPDMKHKEPSECLDEYMKFLSGTYSTPTAYKPCEHYTRCIFGCAIEYRQATVQAISDTLEGELVIPDGIVDICKEYLHWYIQN